MPDTVHTVTAETADAGERLDKFLVSRLPDLSRSRLKALIEEGRVAASGRTIEDASGKVKSGTVYSVRIPEAIPSHMEPQEMDLDMVFEDEHLLVINKPPGLTVHPGAGNPDRTLANALLAHCGESLSGIGGVARPGIVHRIDKDTSGLLVVAKHDAAHVALSKQLADRSLKRTYLAMVWGVPKKTKDTITGHIGRSFSNRRKMAVVKAGGKPAITHYTLQEDFGFAALLECNLETGRTHQIRVHLTHIGHPIVGDPVYGQPASQRLRSGAYKSLPEKTRQTLLSFNRQALHAKALELIHPVTHAKMQFTCEMPADMQGLIEALST